MPARFPPLVPQPPAKAKARGLPQLPWAEFGVFALLGLLVVG